MDENTLTPADDAVVASDDEFKPVHESKPAHESKPVDESTPKPDEKQWTPRRTMTPSKAYLERKLVNNADIDNSPVINVDQPTAALPFPQGHF